MKVIMMLTLMIVPLFGQDLPLEIQDLVVKKNQAIAKIEDTFDAELKKLRAAYLAKGDQVAVKSIDALLYPETAKAEGTDPVVGAWYFYPTTGKKINPWRLELRKDSTFYINLGRQEFRGKWKRGDGVIELYRAALPEIVYATISISSDDASIRIIASGNRVDRKGGRAKAVE